MTVEQLKATYGHWGEHDMVSRAMWKHGIANDRIQVGYWEWVLIRVSSLGEDFPLIFIKDSPYPEYNTDADAVGGFKVGQLVYDIHGHTVAQILAFYLNPCITVRLDSNGVQDIDHIMGLSAGIMNTMNIDDFPDHIKQAIACVPELVEYHTKEKR